MKKEKFQSDCKHFDLKKDMNQEYNPRVDYYDRFWKTFLLN